MEKSNNKRMTVFGRLLSSRQGTLTMGIVNATPDSFSDGGDLEKPLDKALRLLDEGADLLDLGGESSRPGAAAVTVEEELQRVLPTLKSLLKLRPNAIVSIDSAKFEVSQATLDAGAAIINDVWGFRTQPQLPDLLARYGAGIIVMHSRGDSASMRNLCDYGDVVCSVEAELKNLYKTVVASGVDSSSIAIDPGLGFAKTPEQDINLLRATKRLGLIAPVLIGHSRKSFIGKLLGIENPKEREAATLATTLFAAEQGAAIVRVHAVRATVEALKMFYLLNDGNKKT